jgi:uncharacterized protein with HEPN domain
MCKDEKNDLMYLLDILEYIGKIWNYTKDATSVESLYEMNDQLNLNAALNLLANIGESVPKISDELKEEYADIEWQQIKDLRNRIVHNYVGINLSIVYEVITQDLKELKAKLEAIVRTKLQSKIFDVAELEATKGSEFYRFLDYEELEKGLTPPQTA